LVSTAAWVTFSPAAEDPVAYPPLPSPESSSTFAKTESCEPR
jgi:hypothetical protein